MTIVMFFALFFPGGYRPVLTLYNPQPIITHIGVPAPVAHPIIVTGRR